MTLPESIEIIHEDDELLAVNKPAGLLVHKSKIANDETDFLLDRIKQQAGANLYLAHRLDRATSGVLLLAKSREIAGELGRAFMAREVTKKYLAVVRGWPAGEGAIDYPLPGVREHGPRKPALTRWRTLATTTVPIEMGRYPEQRYALVEALPETGRYRQIRKHFHHVSHHIVGDTSHGRGDHNRLWRIHFGMHRMLLHGWQLEFVHPMSGTRMALVARPDPVWLKVLERFGWQDVAEK
ncbi:MAG: pseudouridylate synthase [Proteobacteria bacterium]|uniref:pseudouridine synthase n=1 Tax=Rudaea sp. TaxID=2136325 RepID=UPI003783B6AC|nr:pseudouridylate synthase [Pseudomonadota bacterium]